MLRGRGRAQCWKAEQVKGIAGREEQNMQSQGNMKYRDGLQSLDWSAGRGDKTKGARSQKAWSAEVGNTASMLGSAEPPQG